MKNTTNKHDNPLTGALTKRAILLTLFYLVLWSLGPILFGDQSTSMVAGLPLWFWFSCIMAPIVLICCAFFVFLKR